MVGPQQSIQISWLLLTLGLLIWHLIDKDPLGNAIDAAAFFGLLALSIQATTKVWRWSDLAWRKVWLWALNSSVNWTLEVRLETDDTIESLDLTLINNQLHNTPDLANLKKSIANGALIVDCPLGHSLSIKPIETATTNAWIIHFKPTHIGYRDAMSVLRKHHIPFTDKIADAISPTSNKQYSIEAKFDTRNPYASVLLNDLRASSMDKVLVIFKHDNSTIQVTEKTIVSSSNNQTELTEVMTAVFGISLGGSMSASHI